MLRLPLNRVVSSSVVVVKSLVCIEAGLLNARFDDGLRCFLVLGGVRRIVERGKNYKKNLKNKVPSESKINVE